MLCICGRRFSTRCGGRTGQRAGVRGCPRPAHRKRALFPSVHLLLHRAVHCSATQRAFSPERVKAVTRSRWVGLWETWVKLWAPLCRSRPGLWAHCAELPGVHRSPRFLHRSAHSPGGQNSGSELRKRAFPRFPQALLLRRHIESPGIVWKWGLCTTCRLGHRSLRHRVDPHPHLLSAPCVRLGPATARVKAAAGGG